jgi:hypothetical protein
MNISRLNPFVEILKKNEFKSYQIFENVTGRQFTGSPRMNTAVWPGYNSVVNVQCEKRQKDALIKEIQIMNSQIINESERIMAAVFPCEDFVYFDEPGEEK